MSLLKWIFSIFQWKKRDEEEVNIKESRSKPNIDCAIMCSAQELHTYTDFEIDKQYFFTYTDFEIDKQYFFTYTDFEIDKQYFFQRIFSTARGVPKIWLLCIQLLYSLH